MSEVPKYVALLLFNDFETLDVFGVIGLIGTNLTGEIRYQFTLVSLYDTKNVIPTSRIPTVAEMTITEAIQKRWDLLVIPGGIGFEKVLDKPPLLERITILANKVPTIFTVCTGSLILSATGLLNGIKATTNKYLYKEWTIKYPKVNWVHVARWTHEGKYLCSSGVSAGMVFDLFFLTDLSYRMRLYI